MVRTNRLRELLRAGEPSLGTRRHRSWPTIIELIGHKSIAPPAAAEPYRALGVRHFCFNWYRE